MPKWDYLLLRIDIAKSRNLYLPHMINDDEIPNWEEQKISLAGYFQHLGDKGWELVMQYPELNVFIFKRQKA